MSRRTFCAYFADEGRFLAAVRALGREGFAILDAYTPYPVHGLTEALGWRRSRLPRVTFALGLLGAAFKVWFEFWTSGVSWPLNVGGKPFNSLPAYVPVTFEVMVLLAGVSTVLAFLVVTRSYPGKKAAVLHPRVADDLFAVVLEQRDARFDPHEVRRFLEPFGPVAVEEKVEGGQR